MNIKTITCHRVYNYGASLQEYALLKFLNLNGHNAMAIDYTPDYLSNHHNLLAVSNPKFGKSLLIRCLYLLAKLPERLILLKRKKAFDNFEKEFIPVSNINYTTNAALRFNLPEADAFICGSDQIWNSFFPNGKDPAFYLNFVPLQQLKISYAASFAIDNVEDSLKPFLTENINRIDKVSVREASGLDILRDLEIQNAVQVLDPVFLLDSKFWTDMFVTNFEERYIFVYDCDSNPTIKKIAEYTAKKNKLKIYTINKNINYADKNFYLKGPTTFLSLIFSAAFVISNSFHAVAFSLIFNKVFFVVDRNENINTRMRDIMRYLDLTKLHLGKSDYRTFDDVYVNYDMVNEKIGFKIAESKSFLKNALKQV
jgi:hypothetical protein